MARLRSASATSAGGIVVRYRDSRPEIVLGARRRVRGGRTWTLPKGTPDPGESIEETARREVTEETGLQVDIVGSLGSIEYSFVKAGVRIEKTVHYFLMQPRGGDLDLHDQEFEEVRWVDIEEAPGLLTFPTERALVARASEAIAPVTDAARLALSAEGPVA
ncbi:MAG TPA: NUDIX hydrolase [Candidatus Limnocylindrales bacterium]|nr:NUDIX hydrolase [Candidatus Limnocylindrales bacterium]